MVSPSPVVDPSNVLVLCPIDSDTSSNTMKNKDAKTRCLKTRKREHHQRELILKGSSSFGPGMAREPLIPKNSHH